jgi:hypothetical protein
MDWKVNYLPFVLANLQKKYGARPGIPPAPTLPPDALREVHFATIDARDWDAIEEGLAQFWLKLCDLLLQHYGTPDSPQWDRILLEIDVVNNGRVMTILQHGHAPSAQEDRVTVTVYVPAVREKGESLGSEEAWRELERTLAGALARSASRDPARTRLQALRRRRHFEVMWIASHEDSPRPLDDSSNTTD